MPITQVPKELVKNINPSQLNSEGASNGQVLAYNSTMGAWAPSTISGGSALPSGSVGQVLTYNGATWIAANPTGGSGLPNGSNGQFLRYSSGANAWVAQTVSTLPGGTSGQVLTYDGTSNTWIGSAPVGASLPSGTNGQVLTFNGNTWVAANVATGTVNNVDNTPIGTVSYFAAQTPPVGYLECNGAVVSQTQYPDLYQAIGTRFNKGDEATGNFRLPDLRGEFIRGWDNFRGADSGRTFGSKQDYGTAIPKTTSVQRLQGDGTTTTAPDISYGGFARVSRAGENVTQSTNNDTVYSGLEMDITSVITGDPETRPRNVALLPCIKAVKTVTGSVQSLNFIEKPANAVAGNVLAYDGTKWGAAASSGGGGTARLPAGTTGQILRYNGIEWTAADNVDTIPIGSINYFAAQTPPTGYLECNGAAISQSTYAELFQVIGTRYNTGGEGAVNFRLPDLRGEFIRSWDNGRGVDSGRIFGSNQSNSTFFRDGIPVTDTSSYGYKTPYNEGSYTETRPRNVALLPCIKALKTTTATPQTLNFIEKPSGALNGQVLTYNAFNASWIAGTATGGGSLPSGSNGQVLTHNGTTWIAGNPINETTIYTAVGNAKAGIFASAVCYIPSNPGPGRWTAPPGCYSARVTIVGGGASYRNVFAGDISQLLGRRSHFNYPVGSTPSANQMFADGGGKLVDSRITSFVAVGGLAGWNRIISSTFDQNFNITSTCNVGGGGYGSTGGAGPVSFKNDAYTKGSTYILDGGASFGAAAAGAGSGSGGVNGPGGQEIVTSYIADVNNSRGTVTIPGVGGGAPVLSYAATALDNFKAAMSQKPGPTDSAYNGKYYGPGMGTYGAGGGGWCSAVVAVNPGTSYPYAVGAAAVGGNHGMVVIEW